MRAGWFYGLWRLETAPSATDRVYTEFPDDWTADSLAQFHAALHGGIIGTNDCTFQQRILAEIRGYVQRSKPNFDKMPDRNHRFSSICHKLIDAAELSVAEAILIQAYVPLFTNRCPHRAKRVAQAAVRIIQGNE